MSGTAGAGTWLRSISTTRWKQGAKQSAATGECERMGDNIGGLAVRIGAWVAGLAGPGEVLASSPVKDLVAGSGIVFEDRGAHPLKGIPGEWRVFQVAGV